MSQGVSKENLATGNMIKRRREELGLSQQEVADYVGSVKSTVSRWESGQLSNMGASKIKLLSEMLNISPVLIVMGEEYVAETEENYIVEDDSTTSEFEKYFKENKEKLSSLDKEDSQKLIKLIDLYLD